MGDKKTVLKKAQSIFNIAVKILTNLAIIMVLIIFIKGLINNDTILKPYKVPTYFEKEGISGNLMLSLTLDKYQEITREIFTDEAFDDLAKQDLDFSATIQEVSGIGSSLNSIIDIVRKEFGWERNEISIDIANYPEEYRIYLKFPGNLYRKINITKDSTKKLAVQVEEIAEKIAFEFVLDQNPLILIHYLTTINYDIKDFEGYVQKALESKQEDKELIYLRWANRLIQNGDFDKSYRKIMEAMEIDSTNANVWLELGYYYWNLGKYDKVLPPLQKAIAIDSSNIGSYYYLAQYYGFIEENLPKGIATINSQMKYNMSNNYKMNSYYIKGIFYATLLERDSMEKCIDLIKKVSYHPNLEADIWASYYGKKGDKDLFIKYAQRGLDYGLPIGAYLKEPPYSNYMEDVDFLAFLERNKIENPKNK